MAPSSVTFTSGGLSRKVSISASLMVSEPWPTGGVLIPAGGNVNQIVNARPAGTLFRLGVGVHPFTGSIAQKGGNKYISDFPPAAGKPSRLVGAGTGASPFCLVTTPGLQFKGLDISNFGPADSSEGGAMLHSGVGGTGALVEDCNIGLTNNTVVRWGSGWVVRRTRMYDGGRYAMSGGGNLGVKTLQDCEWFHCGWTADGSDRGGNKFSLTTGVVIDGLWTHGHWGNGLWLDIQNMAGTIDRLVSEDNGKSGLFLEVSYGPFTVNSPIIRRCGANKSGQPADWPVPAGILISMTPDVAVNNPVVEDCRNGISIIQWDHPQIIGTKGNLDESRCGNENVIVTGGRVTRSLEYDGGLAGTRPAGTRPTRNVHYNGVQWDADARFRGPLHVAA